MIMYYEAATAGIALKYQHEIEIQEKIFNRKKGTIASANKR